MTNPIRTLLSAGALACLAVGLAACGSNQSSSTTTTSEATAAASPAAMTGSTSMKSAAAAVNVTMNAQNGSKEHGTATLTQSGKNVVVKISLANGTSYAQPAHIHEGTCAHLNPVPKYPLTNAVHGMSTTTLKDMSLKSLLGGKYAVNVHQSAKDIKKYVSCGDIK